MPAVKKTSQADQLARAAADRIERQRALGAQLTFLPDEAPGEGARAVEEGKGRGKARALNLFRQWLAHRGYDAPEEQIARMAGLDQRDADPVEQSMVAAERLLAWAGDGAVQMTYSPTEGQKVVRDPTTGEPMPWAPTPAERLEVFKQVYTVQLRALEALLPYGLPKPGADAPPAQPVQILVQQGEARQVQPGEGARDVGAAGDQARAHGRMGPPPMPWEMQENQQDGAERGAQSDSGESDK